MLRIEQVSRVLYFMVSRSLAMLKKTSGLRAASFFSITKLLCCHSQKAHVACTCPNGSSAMINSCNTPKPGRASVLTEINRRCRAKPQPQRVSGNTHRFHFNRTATEILSVSLHWPFSSPPRTGSQTMSLSEICFQFPGTTFPLSEINSDHRAAICLALLAES